MPCPYCAVFGQNVFDQPLSAPTLAPENSAREPHLAVAECSGGGEVHCADEPSWPVTFNLGHRQGPATTRGRATQSGACSQVS